MAAIVRVNRKGQVLKSREQLRMRRTEQAGRNAGHDEASRRLVGEPRFVLLRDALWPSSVVAKNALFSFSFSPSLAQRPSSSFFSWTEARRRFLLPSSTIVYRVLWGRGIYVHDWQVSRYAGDVRHGMRNAGDARHARYARRDFKAVFVQAEVVLRAVELRLNPN